MSDMMLLCLPYLCVYSLCMYVSTCLCVCMYVCVGVGVLACMHDILYRLQPNVTCLF